ncbi:MAG: hypothetical protein HON55_00795, partial [Legionellales bacterium]|nr:hypothetical protein [Legionellales bacterium]
LVSNASEQVEVSKYVSELAKDIIESSTKSVEALVRKKQAPMSPSNRKIVASQAPSPTAVNQTPSACNSPIRHEVNARNVPDFPYMGPGRNVDNLPASRLFVI